jgi:hypothetical protein
MLPRNINQSRVLFFEGSCDFQDTVFLTTLFRNLSLNQPDAQIHTHKSTIMPLPQAVYDPASLFAEHAQNLTNFNPDSHLDDSYLDVHHPERVESLFHRRQAQLAIISENSPLNMDPLNWRYMYRPNRPFYYINNCNLRCTILKLPPRPWLQRQQQKPPTDYYLEQMSFFNAIPPAEEDAEPIDVPPSPGPLKVLAQLAWGALLTVAWMLLIVMMIVVGVVRRVVGGAIRAYEKVGGFPWEVLWFTLAASQLLRFLPRMEGLDGTGVKVAEVWKADPPLYVVMIQNQNQWSEYPVLEVLGIDADDDDSEGSGNARLRR